MALKCPVLQVPGTTCRRYIRGEQVADQYVHILGVGTALGACVLLLASEQRSDDTLGRIALALYAFGLITMLSCSALYNFMRDGQAKSLLRRLDHAAIFVMIAATYTPVTVLAIPGLWSRVLLATVWLGAIVGATLKLLVPARFERLSIVAYLLLGWAGVAMFRPLAEAVAVREIVLLAMGGLLYSLGVVAHLSTGMRYHNVLWHVFVLSAAGCHYIAIYYIAAA